MSVFKGFSIQFFVCIWFGLFSVSNAVEAKIAKRLKYESQPTHYMEKHIPRDTFIQKRRASGSQMHEVVIAVHQLNIPKLQEIVIQRATPGHPQYQQWLSFEEVGTMVRNEEGYGKVMEWLEAYEVDVKWSSPYGEYIRAEGRISQWEKMLSTEFYEFEDLSHKKGELDKGKMFYRALEYWIPSELEGSITAIFNTVQTPPEYKARYGSRILKEKASSIYPYEDTPYKTHLRADSLLSKDSHSPKIHTAQTGDDVTVDFLNKLYKISSNIASPLLNQSVFQTGNQYFSPQDLTSFQNYYSLTKQPAMSIGNRAVDTCPQTSAASCDEGNLDLQYIMGVAQKTGTIFWYVSQNNGDPFLAWITDVSAEQYPPQSNSISWGSVETFVSPATVLLWEIEAMKLAGRGVTISVSSGDDGAPNSSSSGTCYCSSARPSAKGYNPYYPATSRWVTTIGATMGPETGGAEVVCDSKQGGVITSGGGFSTIVSRPSYQNSTVSLYFQRVASSPPVSGFTVAGRAYPDLSFIGVNYQVIIAGYFYSVFGTSASAPVFAAFVTLLNSARLAANKTAIGFINPTLYEVGYNISTTTRNIYNATFNDVTSGNNKCCKSSVAANAVCCDTGFTAIEGWDPVTGWGSINYPDFAKIFEVAAPYTPSESKKDDSKTIGGVPVLIIGIVIIVIVLLVLFSLLTFCCCTKSSVVNAAPRNAAVYPTTAQAAPPVTQVQVQYVNYQPHLPQPAQQKYAPSF